MLFQCYTGVVGGIPHTPKISTVAEAFGDVVMLNAHLALNTQAIQLGSAGRVGCSFITVFLKTTTSGDKAIYSHMLIFNRLLARNILALIRSKFRFLKIHSTGAKSAATYPIEPSIPDAYEICAKGRADKVNTSMRTDRVVVIPSKICPLKF